MKTRTLVALMGIGLLMAVTGGVRAADDPPKTAADTVNRMFELLKAGDVDAAARYVYLPEPGLSALKRAAGRVKSGQLAVVVADSKEDGDLAVVIVKAVDEDEGGDAGALYDPSAMMCRDGVWRMYPSSRKIEAAATAAREGVAKEKIEVAPKQKMGVRPSIGEPDMQLEGADRERMDVLWKWAKGRCEELSKDAKKPATRNIPPTVDVLKQTKEWQALNRLVGSWDYQVTLTGQAAQPGRISGTAAWTLGDRFLLMKSRREDNTESMSLLTCGPNGGTVRWWSFSSLGNTVVYAGRWDEATNTFTFREQDAAPMSYTSTDHFIDDDHREGKDILTGPDGKVVFEVSVKATRRKKPTEKAALASLAPPAADDFRQTKECKALNRYVGLWEDQVTVTVPDRKQSHGSNTVAWTLGDRFLQMKYMEDGTESMFLFTYDANRRAVRAWMFSSLGYSVAFTGSWDETTSTLTLKVDDAGPGSSTATERFIDDDHHEWKLIAKDADGKVVYESSGKRTRQKK
jgi:hypothetical protein